MDPVPDISDYSSRWYLNELPMLFYSSDALSEPWRTMSAVQIMTVLADERGKRFVIA